MRLVSFALLVAVACELEPIPTRTVLETTATSYVATPLTGGSFDYSLSVITKLRNTSDDLVRISQCKADVFTPTYFVEPKGGGRAAWDPDLKCVVFGAPYRDLRPGEERIDTIPMRAPWSRLITGEPVGEIEGTFFLVYETRICALVNTNGSCYPLDAREYVRSNHFTVRK